MKPPTRAPFYASLYPGLCDVARKHGYALAIHGTVTSDLDLIACPWIEEAGEPEELKRALMEHLDACDYKESLIRFGLSSDEADKAIGTPDRSEKPHGRIAWNLYLDNGCKVDLSVMPKINKI